VLERARSHLTYANIMATVAVFISLSAGAYAAARIGANAIKNDAIRSRHIKDGQVRSSDVQDDTANAGTGGLTAQDIANGSLSGADLASHAVGADQLDFRSVGADQLAPHAVTAAKLGQITIQTAQVTVPAAGGIEGNGSYATAGATATCPKYETALGGAAYWDTTASDKELTISQTQYTEDTYTGGYAGTVTRPRSYTARGGNDTSQDHVLTVQVVCLENPNGGQLGG
jgi:hypothetical protein